MSAGSQSGSAAQMSASASNSLAPFRDAEGYLPFRECSKCGTTVIGRVSQQPKSKGQRFYKCPSFEHTPMACKFYMFEQQYVEYLVSLRVLPRSCSQLKGREVDLVGNETVNQADKVLKEAIGGVERCTDILEIAVSQLKAVEDALKNADDKLKAVEDALKNADDRKKALESKVDKLGERLVVLGLANLLLVVLVLMVLLVK